MVVRFDILPENNEVLFDRARGRRIDPDTGEEYHLTSNPPPDDEIIKERLVPPEGAEAIESKLPGSLALRVCCIHQ